MSLPDLAADIADRIAGMQVDNKLNNAEVIQTLLTDWVTKNFPQPAQPHPYRDTLRLAVVVSATPSNRQRLNALFALAHSVLEKADDFALIKLCQEHTVEMVRPNNCECPGGEVYDGTLGRKVREA